jgi:hypothetical protein
VKTKFLAKRRVLDKQSGVNYIQEKVVDVILYYIFLLLFLLINALENLNVKIIIYIDKK